MSLFALYAAVETVNALAVRSLHLLFALIVIFLFYPAARRFKIRVNVRDWVLTAGALASVGYVAWYANDLQFRAAVPNLLDLILGAPLDVSSTFIILFTIYGAVLEVSGAGKFFVDFALGCMGEEQGRRWPGRDPGLLPAWDRLRKRRCNYRHPRVSGLASPEALWI